MNKRVIKLIKRVHVGFRIAGLKIERRLLAANVYHDYEGEHYDDWRLIIRKGNRIVLKVNFWAWEGWRKLTGTISVTDLKKYIPGVWESKILKSRC